MSHTSLPSLTVDPLFVGASRPPMRWGVTSGVAVIQIIIAVDVSNKESPFSALLSAVHGVCALFCARDARFFDIMLWGRTRLPAGWKPEVLACKRLQSVAVDVPCASWTSASTAGHCDDDCLLDKGVAVMLRRNRFVNRMAALRREPVAAERVPAGLTLHRMSSRLPLETTCRSFRFRGASFESADESSEQLARAAQMACGATSQPECGVVESRHAATRATASPTCARRLCGSAGYANIAGGSRARRSWSTSCTCASSTAQRQVSPRGWCRGALRETPARTARSSGVGRCAGVCEKLVGAPLRALARYEPETLGRPIAWAIPGILAAGISTACWSTASGSACRCRAAPLHEVLGDDARHLRHRGDRVSPADARRGWRISASRSTRRRHGRHVRRAAVGAFPFVLTQSFTFLDARRPARGCCSGSTTAWRMPATSRSAGRGAQGGARCADQQRVRDGRPSLLAAGAVRMSTTRSRRAADAQRLKALNDHVALARAMLADTGMIVAREDLALEAAFWAQLPGTFRCGRARRRSPRATSRRWRRSTTIRLAVRPAITGAMRWRC